MDEQSRYHTLLRDSARRRIVEVLGEQGKVGFKELKQVLGLGVGTVYYHLDMLSDYLSQDKQRKYRLNDRGRLLYESLKGGRVPLGLRVGEAFSHRLVRWLFLAPLFAKTAQPLRLFPFSLAVLVFGALGSALASSQSLLLFYSPFTLYAFETTALLYLFNWVTLFFFSDLVIFCCLGGLVGICSCLFVWGLRLFLWVCFLMFFCFFLMGLLVFFFLFLWFGVWCCCLRRFLLVRGCVWIGLLW